MYVVKFIFVYQIYCIQNNNKVNSYSIVDKLIEKVNRKNKIFKHG